MRAMQSKEWIICGIFLAENICFSPVQFLTFQTSIDLSGQCDMETLPYHRHGQQYHCLPLLCVDLEVSVRRCRNVKMCQ